MRSTFRSTAVVLLLASGLTALLADSAAAQVNYEIIHNFWQTARQPERVVRAADGRIFGTKAIDGEAGYGTVYVLEPDGQGGYTETILVNFDGSNGGRPYGGLADGGDGAMYGTTQVGGTYNRGTIYRIDADGTHTLLHSFNFSEGYSPVGGMSLGSDGNLYGTTQSGGLNGRGTIFRLTTSGVLTAFAHLTSAASSFSSPPVLATDGNVYAAAISASGGYGAVLRASPTGIVTVLHTFAGPFDGAYPYGGVVQGPDGAIYGTTYYNLDYDEVNEWTIVVGYGTIYRMTMAGAFSVVKSFATSSTDGRLPYGGLTVALDGNLYGTTYNGGQFGRGNIYRLTTAGAFTSLYSFNSAQSYYPRTTMFTGGDGKLYGSLSSSESQLGGVFSTTLSGLATVEHDFEGDASGGTGFSGVAEFSGGTLVGASHTGGTQSRGALYRLASDGSQAEWMDLDLATGYNPLGQPIIASDGNAYGVARFGGQFGAGVVYRLTPGGVYDIVHSFQWSNGAYPFGGLIQASNGRFYGTTTGGGTSGRGVIFQLTSEGDYSVLYNFSTTDGRESQDALVEREPGVFFGATAYSDANNSGTLFRITAAGAYTELHTFQGGDFVYAYSGPTLASDGNLYGVTYRGGAHDRGSLYQVASDDTVSIIHDFNTGGGALAYPLGGLIEASDGYLYGTTSSGGTLGRGGVFRLTPSGAVETVYSFTSADGYNQRSRLHQHSSGLLYGTTQSGGTRLRGVVYRLTLPAMIGLSDLTHTYDGSPKAATATTTPSTLGVDITYSQGGVPVAAPTDAGSYQVAAVINDAVYSGTATGTLVINKAVATVTLSDLSQVYDGASTGATVTTDPPGLPVSVTYRQSGIGVTPFNVGSYDVEAVVNHPNYTGSASGTLEITAAEAVVSLGTLNFVYDGTPKSTTATTSPGGLGTVSITYNGSPTPPTDAGSYTVVASLSHPNYAATPVSGSLVIAPATPTLSVTGGTFTYDGNPHAATGSATGVNGEALGPLTFTYNGSGTAPTGAGSYAVVASFAGSANYAAADDSTAEIVIDPASPVVSATGGTFTYDGNPHPATGSVTGIDGEDLGPPTFTYNGNGTAPVDAGTYTVVASFAGSQNYAAADDSTAEIVIDPASPVVSATGGTFTYDGNPHPATGSVTGVNGEDLGAPTFAYNGDASAPVDAGTYAVVAAFAGSQNYAAADDSTAEIVIDPAAATLSIGDLSHVYDGTPKAATIDGDPAGLTGFTVTYDGSTTTPTDAGSYAVEAVVDDPNYVADPVSGTLVIDPATPVVSATGGTFTYDGNPHAATGSVTGVNGEDLGTPTFTYNGDAAAPVDAGTYAVVASFAGNQNYDSADDSSAEVVIDPAAATLALGNLSHVYDGTPKAATATTDPAGIPGVTVTYDGATTAPTDAGSYVVEAALSDGNYAATPTTGTLTIDKATPTVSWDPPAPIVLGTALGATQLDASASIAGSFAYTPGNGTVLAAGTNQDLTAVFTPDDAENYETVEVSTTIDVRYADGLCLGQPGRMVLNPISADGTSVFKRNSTVPVKFRVCDASGASVGSPGVVQSFVLAQIINGTVTTTVDDSVPSTTPDSSFRWDASGQQWIFNVSTKGMQTNRTYVFAIMLDDGTQIWFQFGLR